MKHCVSEARARKADAEGHTAQGPANRSTTYTRRHSQPDSCALDAGAKPASARLVAGRRVGAAHRRPARHVCRTSKFETSNSYADELRETAKYISSRGKGILASDESNATTGKRLATVNVENTEDNRRAWRECLYTAPGLGQYISGAMRSSWTLLYHVRCLAPRSGCGLAICRSSEYCAYLWLRSSRAVELCTGGCCLSSVLHCPNPDATILGQAMSLFCYTPVVARS